MTDTRITQSENKGPEHVSERPAVAARVDVYENAKELLLVADLPGVTKESLSIQVDAETLSIEGRRAAAPSGSLVSAEYRPSDFRRTFTVPQGIDRAKIEAELNAGILKLHLPKEERVQPRKIPIRVG
jgi:HSP20 family molecular chaperone IbpA